MTSSWRRNADEALPARGKIVGGYVNMAFQKSEAELNGFDEALVLTADGHVNEASAANLFVVRDGVALTPPVTDDILEGVTRKAIMELIAQRGHPASRCARSTAPSCTSPTRSSCAAPASRCRRSSRSTTARSASGAIGPIARLVRDRYFDAVRGRLPEYAHWLTPIALRRGRRRRAERGSGRRRRPRGRASSRPMVTTMSARTAGSVAGRGRRRSKRSSR